MLRLIKNKTQPFFNFIISPFRYFFKRAYRPRKEDKLIGLINKHHSNFRIYTTKQLRNTILKNNDSRLKTLQSYFLQAKHEQDGIDYLTWVALKKTASSSVLTPLNARSTRQSILFFISSTQEKTIKIALVKQTLSSLKNQTSGHWSACVICNSSEQATKIFSQTIVCTLYIGDNTELPLLMHQETKRHGASYVCIVPQGTLLAPDAVYRLLHTFTQHAPSIIYSDDDLISPTGKRHSPHFKPDWNPDYFYSLDYLSHSCVMACSLLDTLKVQASNSDHCLYALLYNSSVLAQQSIYHLSDVLFHYPNNTPQIGRPKPWQRKELSSTPLISIIIPTRDEVSLLRQCVNSLLEKTHYLNFEIIIIDNQSEQQATFDYFESLKHTRRLRVLRYPYSFNYSAINNYAVKYAQGELLAFVNNDIEVINSEWLTEMVFHALRPEIGCVGAKLYYPDGTIQHGGVILGVRGIASHAHKSFTGDHSGYFKRLSVVHNVSAVTAACMVVRTELFAKAGGFDEENLAVAYNDVDLCLKILELGYRNLWTPYARLIHYESKSRGKKHTKETRKRLDQEEEFMRIKWMKYLENDPAYNINLTLTREDFSLGNIRTIPKTFDTTIG